MKINPTVQPDRLSQAAASQVMVTSASWQKDELFRKPLMRTIYDEKKTDESIRKLFKLVQAQDLNRARLPKSFLFIEDDLLKRKHFRYGVQIYVP